MRVPSSAEQFGASNLRVLTVTTGEGRKVANAAQKANKVCDGLGSGCFLVTSFSALAHGDVFEIPWLDASGREVRLEI
jgi:hypothetical protein